MSAITGNKVYTLLYSQTQRQSQTQTLKPLIKWIIFILQFENNELNRTFLLIIEIKWIFSSNFY